MSSKNPEAETNPDVIARNIEHTRQDMTQTLDAIQQRLEPEQVTEYVKDVAHYVILEVKDAVRDLAGQATGAIREAKSKTKKDERPAASSGVTAPHGNGQQNQTGDQVEQKKDQLTGQMQEKAGLVTGKMQEKTGQVTGQMKEKADTMQQQGQGLWQMLKSNPVAIGALGVAVGGLAAAIVPATQKENELMGETRDNVLGSVQEVAGQTIDTVKSAASEAGTAVMDEAKSQAAAAKRASKSGASA
ncbi:MAG: DUF3618 domain-containing protein [Chloroflexia bacterium]|nr:DUF3618 domain-containing protein [Chloroflexia bacterium]